MHKRETTSIDQERVGDNISTERYNTSEIIGSENEIPINNGVSMNQVGHRKASYAQ